MGLTFTLVVLAGTTYVLYVYQNYRNMVRKYGHLPYISSWYSNHFVPAHMFPSLFTYGPRFHKHVAAVFDHVAPNDGVFALIAPFKTMVYVNSAQHFHDLTTAHRKHVVKPSEIYKIFEIYGPTIVTLPEGSDWLRHRTVCTSTFGEANCALVAERTAELATRMCDMWEVEGTREAGEGSGIVVPVQDYTRKLAFSVIATAGFGMDIDTFALPKDTPQNEADTKYKLSLSETVQMVSENLILRLVVPKWAYKLPVEKLRKTDLAFREFEARISEVIDRHRSSANPNKATEGPRSLLSCLCEGTLSPTEVLSDTFMFLVAGHETTAHTLTFALGLLALHPDVQQRLRDEVDTVLCGRTPTLSDLRQLPFTHHVMHETMRMLPAVTSVPKKTTGPIILAGHVIPADSNIVLSVQALHHNPIHHPDPTRFDPTRWEGPNPPKAAFAPFSLGPRSCIGRRFAEVEIVVTLAMLAQRYTLHLAAGVTAAHVFDTHVMVAQMPARRWDVVCRRRGEG